MKMNLKEHVKIFQRNLRRHQTIYARLNKRWSTNPHVYLWRNRFYFIKTFAEAGLLMTQKKKSKIDVAPTLRAWRNSQGSSFISRHIVASLCDNLSPVTPMEINFAVEGEYKSTMVTRVLKDGVNLGLLYKADNEYHGTSLLYEESLDLIVAKILDDKLVAFCRLVVMFADMRANAKKAGELSVENLPADINHLSITELLFQGVYDDEIFGDDDDDDDKDEGSSPVRLIS